MNFQICGRRAALNSIQLTTKYNSATSPEYKSARDKGFDAASDWCMGWSGRERCWRCHWPSVQASPYLHSVIGGYYEYSL